MNRLCLICSRLKRRANLGFFLLEMQISLFVTILLLSLLAYGIGLGWRSWQTLSEEHELRDSSRYIMGRIEKDINLGATLVNVKKSGVAGKSILEINTLDAKHVIRIYCDQRRLYRKIITRAGSGVNPLYINNVYVYNWQANVVDDKKILIGYELKTGNSSQSFQELIYCHNGVVQIYEE